MKKTLENLIKAFIGESQARNRYTYYAKAARKEGFEQIGAIFAETADQEKEHAKRLFEHIQELKEKKDETTVDAAAPLIYGKTMDNLKAAIVGEHYEHSEMYPEFADVAEKEGYKAIAKRLRSIAVAEEHHEERYKKLLKEIRNKTIFKKTKKVWWACRECGYGYFSKMPPIKCPSCDHPKGFYQVKREKY